MKYENDQNLFVFLRLTNKFANKIHKVKIKSIYLQIHLELGYFIDDLHTSIIENGETAINLIPNIEITVASIINQLLFGFAYHGNEKVQEFIKIKETINIHMRLAGSPGALLAMHYPKIAPYLPIIKGKYHELIDGYHTIIDYCQKQINAHKNDAKSKDAEPNDYVDAYLREAERQGKDSTFTEKQVSFT
uniref:Uncharacterized protein n=1 Tax=Panagrolaimus superbus TaxID=310955 RepID=A0A914ZG61_9BILA